MTIENLLEVCIIHDLKTLADALHQNELSKYALREIRLKTLKSSLVILQKVELKHLLTHIRYDS